MLADALEDPAAPAAPPKTEEKPADGLEATPGAPETIGAPVGRLVGGAMTPGAPALPLAPAADAALLALFWNASKLLSAVGFTAKTIPIWQWTTGFVCAQKNHKGVLASLRVKLQEGSEVEELAARKPESIPVGERVHGAAKVDWVTEWFFETKLNWMVSPT